MSRTLNGRRKGIPDEYRKDFREMEYGEIVAWLEDCPLVEAVKYGLKVLMRVDRSAPEITHNVRNSNYHQASQIASSVIRDLRTVSAFMEALQNVEEEEIDVATPCSKDGEPVGIPALTSRASLSRVGC